MKKAILAFLVLVLAGVSAYYVGFGGSKAYTVEEVLAQPAKFQGKRVCVKGTVEKPLVALVAGYFRLRGEKGGVIYVVSTQGVPSAGAKVTVCGTFREAYRIGHMSLPVLLP